jgi:hypothetical protein
MDTAVSLTAPPPPAPVLIDVLAHLGRPAPVADDCPPEHAVLHLARVLAAVAERHAVAAELAAARTGSTATTWTPTRTATTRRR